MFALQTSSDQIDAIDSKPGIMLSDNIDFIQPALAGAIAAAGS